MGSEKRGIQGEGVPHDFWPQVPSLVSGPMSFLGEGVPQSLVPGSFLMGEGEKGCTLVSGPMSFPGMREGGCIPVRS